MSYRSRTQQRDDAIVDAVNRDATIDRSLMCRAVGCPLRWSVNGEGRVHLCSAHAWADPKDWPRITQHLQERTDAQLLGHAQQDLLPAASRREALAKLQQFVAKRRAPGELPQQQPQEEPW
ncbi:hypothetical protein CDN99_06565 [Roseateles aquatilis]|uniref:Uncharacterized protein n=1 Tax=Roseateles aquatilis TaxID=431061 RepID=A0A246JHH2_9BURK|nr:hypothetical protein [Roseateles aquatilis]OWQ92015.1 hypothetical protein CDN99_06565 [Roseateles aquatilis]